MADYNEYKFFAVFSRLNCDMDGEPGKAMRQNEYKTLLLDAVRETGMVSGAPMIQRDKGIGQSGSNRTFCFDIYVSKETMEHPETFDGEEFKESVEMYINHNEDYSWMQVLTKEDIDMGRAADFI